jgi:hypothetical protein
MVTLQAKVNRMISPPQIEKATENREATIQLNCCKPCYELLENLSDGSIAA